MTVGTDEEKAQVERLRYVLSNGVKEDSWNTRGTGPASTPSPPCSMASP
jgi:hypothetical protein